MGGDDATNWNEAAYKSSILKSRESLSRTVFRAVFAPSPNPSPEKIVVASSDGSLASYSISKCISSSLLGFGSTGAHPQRFLEAEPDSFFQAHDGPAYDVKFYGEGEDALLLSCGDDGRIRGWRWSEITNSEITQPMKENCISPSLELKNPQDKGPWGALSPMPENNAIAVDAQGGSLFAAAGDSCAYSWDVEKGQINMVFKGHSDYLHCIVARNSSNQIVTGSEDGTARMWDCRTGKSIRVINARKDKNMRDFSCVSCIALDASESWLTCGSGKTLSIWNLPSLECVSRISNRSSIQDIEYVDNQILAVGADNLLNRFDMDGLILSQIQCAPPSAFSFFLHRSGVTAVGGYGGLVDIISQFGSHLSTFRCKSLCLAF